MSTSTTSGKRHRFGECGLVSQFPSKQYRPVSGHGAAASRTCSVTSGGCVKPHKRPELRGVWGPSASGALDAVPHPPGIMASTTRMDKNHTLMTKQN